MKDLLPPPAALFLALTGATPSAAQQQISVRVPYADLNLAEPNGVARLKRPMDDAVTRICGTSDPRDIGAMTLLAACRGSTSATVARRTRRLIAAARQARALTYAEAGGAR